MKSSKAEASTQVVPLFPVAPTDQPTMRGPEALPLHRDPFAQLVVLVGVATLSLGFALTLSDHSASTGLLVVVGGSGFLSVVVLLRALVRGQLLAQWTERREFRRREAIVEGGFRQLAEFAARPRSSRETAEVLQILTEHVYALVRTTVPAASVTAVQLREQRYRVLGSCGVITKPPFGVRAGKSCAADRPFDALVQSFVPKTLAITRVELPQGTNPCFVVILGHQTRDAVDGSALRFFAAGVKLALAVDREPSGPEEDVAGIDSSRASTRWP